MSRRSTVSTLLALIGTLVAGASARAGDDMVLLCHVAPAIPQEIAVSEGAAAAHLELHASDALGACSAPAACPCWAAEDLRAALAALPDDPVLEDDPVLSLCEQSVRSPTERFSAALVFQDLAGVASDGAVVDFNQNQQRCIIAVDGLGLGLEPVEVVGLTSSEAAACARIVGEICTDILP